MENPFRVQPREIARIYFRKAAEAPAGIVPVVGGPIRRWWLNQKILRAYIDCGGYSRRRVISRPSCRADENGGNKRRPPHPPVPCAAQRPDLDSETARAKPPKQVLQALPPRQ